MFGWLCLFVLALFLVADLSLRAFGLLSPLDSRPSVRSFIVQCLRLPPLSGWATALPQEPSPVPVWHGARSGTPQDTLGDAPAAGDGEDEWPLFLDAVLPGLADEATTVQPLMRAHTPPAEGTGRTGICGGVPRAG